MSQVVRRVGAILRELENYPEGRSVAEIANAIELPRSTVHRLLKALETEHLIASASEERGFRLGPGLVRLAANANNLLVETFRPFLHELSRTLDETVDLSILTGDEIYFIDQIAASHRLQAVSDTGLAFPVHAGANGKAILAEMSNDQVKELLSNNLPALTPNTITDIATFLSELEKVRETGVAFDREEHHLGISAASTVIEHPSGIAAAVSVPVPSSRFVDREEEIVEALLKSKQRIEQHVKNATT